MIRQLLNQRDWKAHFKLADTQWRQRWKCKPLIIAINILRTSLDAVAEIILYLANRIVWFGYAAGAQAVSDLLMKHAINHWHLSLEFICGALLKWKIWIAFMTIQNYIRCSCIWMDVQCAMCNGQFDTNAMSHCCQNTHSCWPFEVWQ